MLFRSGFLDDYANLSRAALALHNATGTRSYLADAERWMRTLHRDFAAASGGGYYYAPEDADERLLVRPRHAHDGPQPSGNGTAAAVFAHLAALTGEETYRQRAAGIVRAFATLANQHPVSFATVLNSFETLTTGQQIVVVTDDDSDPLVRAARAAPRPDRVVQLISPGTALAANHPAAGKDAIGGQPTAYVCVGTRCSLPVHTADQLSQLLKVPQ